MGTGSVIYQAASILLTRPVIVPMTVAATSGGITMLGKVPSGKKWRVLLTSTTSGSTTVWTTAARPNFIRTTLTGCTTRQYTSGGTGALAMAIPSRAGSLSGDASVFPLGPVPYWCDTSATPGHWVYPIGAPELSALDYTAHAIHPDGIWRVASSGSNIRVRSPQQRLGREYPTPSTAYTDYATTTLGQAQSADFSPLGLPFMEGRTDQLPRA